MAEGLRLTEKWMHHSLWLVAGGHRLRRISHRARRDGGDLPKVERRLSLDDFMDRAATSGLRSAIKNAELAGQNAESALQQALLKRRAGLSRLVGCA